MSYINARDAARWNVVVAPEHWCSKIMWEWVNEITGVMKRAHGRHSGDHVELFPLASLNQTWFVLCLTDHKSPDPSAWLVPGSVKAEQRAATASPVSMDQTHSATSAVRSSATSAVDWDALPTATRDSATRSAALPVSSTTSPTVPIAAQPRASTLAKKQLLEDLTAIRTVSKLSQDRTQAPRERRGGSTEHRENEGVARQDREEGAMFRASAVSARGWREREAVTEEG